MSANEINHCDKHGVCTCQHFPDETKCRFFTAAMVYPYPGACIMRTWYAACMSSAAVEAAKLVME